MPLLSVRALRLSLAPLAGVLAIVLGATLAAAPACESYEPPPRPQIVGLSSGILTDSRAPIVVDFGVPVEEATVRIKVALNETDIEGNLLDEDADPESELDVLLRRDPDEGDLNVNASLDDSGTIMTLVPQSSLPVGPKLVLILEAGATSTSGHVSRIRQKVNFSYVVQCANQPSTKFVPGVYFALLEVEQPIGTQIQILASIDVDPTTGDLVGQFTNADRNLGLQCPTPCGAADVCRLLPAPECVPPSTRAGSVEEWADFGPNEPPPTGYSFLVQGCAVDDGEASGVITAPATMVVQSPKVTVEGLTMTASFKQGADGLVRATGSLTADTVRLGTNPLGPGKGSMTAIRLPDDRVPPGVPAAKTSGASAGDGGADAGR